MVYRPSDQESEKKNIQIIVSIETNGIRIFKNGEEVDYFLTNIKPGHIISKYGYSRMQLAIDEPWWVTEYSTKNVEIYDFGKIGLDTPTSFQLVKEDSHLNVGDWINLVGKITDAKSVHIELRDPQKVPIDLHINVLVTG